MTLRKQFGNRLRRLRRTARMTQQDLAESASVTVEYVSKLERGLASPSFDVLERLCAALRVRASDLFLFDARAPAVGGATLTVRRLPPMERPQGRMEPCVQDTPEYPLCVLRALRPSLDGALAMLQALERTDMDEQGLERLYSALAAVRDILNVLDDVLRQAGEDDVTSPLDQAG